MTEINIISAIRNSTLCLICISLAGAYQQRALLTELMVLTLLKSQMIERERSLQLSTSLSTTKVKMCIILLVHHFKLVQMQHLPTKNIFFQTKQQQSNLGVI